MRKDFEEEFSLSIQKTKSPWALYAVIGIFSAAALTGFGYLHCVGWGIVIDAGKLASAFSISGTQKYVKTQEPDVASTQYSKILREPEIEEQKGIYTPLKAPRLFVGMYR